MALTGLARATYYKYKRELREDAYEKALADFHAEPETYSLDEVEKELGLM